ncbi:hypothetical protein [Phenylobacterium sp.]|uniref:hypothetical protein n=1 Tax=Phenylobacterium sp. TaxID=1871053 RepID=UPI0035B25C37
MKAVVAATDELLASIAARAETPDTLEDYLRNHLVAFREAASEAKVGTEIENAARSLSRFCTEHMDWNSDLFRQCAELIRRARLAN